MHVIDHGSSSPTEDPRNRVQVDVVEVDDVDAACEYFTTKGLEIELQPRMNERFQIYQMFLRDPNGYCIEIQRFLDPHWQRENRLLE